MMSRRHGVEGGAAAALTMEGPSKAAKASSKDERAPGRVPTLESRAPSLDSDVAAGERDASPPASSDSSMTLPRLLAFAVIGAAAAKAVPFVADAYKTELAAFSPEDGSSFFHWTPVGGMIAGRAFGPWTAGAMAVGQAVAYALLLWATAKLRPATPSPSLKKWLFAHNVIMSLFSGGIVLACAFEMYRATTSHGPWYCATCESKAYEVIHAIWVASKAYEWVDTIFLVLQNKKPIPLHLWHHCSTSVFFGLLSPYSYISKIGILMNGSIHFVMYGHYARPLPRAWRSWITRFQILQFATSMAWGWKASSCFENPEERTFSQLLGHSMVASYLLLFVQFYLNDKKRRASRKKSKAV